MQSNFNAHQPVIRVTGSPPLKKSETGAEQPALNNRNNSSNPIQAGPEHFLPGKAALLKPDLAGRNEPKVAYWDRSIPKDFDGDKKPDSISHFDMTGPYVGDTPIEYYDAEKMSADKFLTKVLDQVRAGKDISAVHLGVGRRVELKEFSDTYAEYLKEDGITDITEQNFKEKLPSERIIEYSRRKKQDIGPIIKQLEAKETKTAEDQAELKRLKQEYGEMDHRIRISGLIDELTDKHNIPVITSGRDNPKDTFDHFAAINNKTIVVGSREHGQIPERCSTNSLMDVYIDVKTSRLMPDGKFDVNEDGKGDIALDRFTNPEEAMRRFDNQLVRGSSQAAPQATKFAAIMHNHDIPVARMKELFQDANQQIDEGNRQSIDEIMIGLIHHEISN